MTNSSEWEELSFEKAVEPISDEGRRVDQRDYQKSGALPVIDQGEDFVGGYTDDLSKSYTGPLPVVVFGDHTRRVKLVRERFAVGAQGVKLLRPRPGWSAKYFAYLLPTLPIPDRGYSRHYQFVRKLTFRRPPLDKQEQIVAELEKQFTRLDAGVLSLKRIQTALKRYRASVLKTACEGRLVPTEAELARKENRSYETGDELLRRILKDRREKWNGKGKYKEPAAPNILDLPNLPEGWAWATVQQIGQATTGFTPPKGKAGYFGGAIPFFKPTDLDAGYYVRDFRDSLTAAGAKYGRLLPEHSVLVTCIGATIGKTGLARVACATNQQINALTVPGNLLSPEFVFWVFNSPFGQRQIIGNASATTLPILNKSKFEALPLPLPPLSEQKRIVAEVERRLSVIEELESVATASVQRGTRLRQSILQRAFSASS